MHGGMGGYHVLGELKAILDDVGREAQAAVEKSYVISLSVLY